MWKLYLHSVLIVHIVHYSQELGHGGSQWPSSDEGIEKMLVMYIMEYYTALKMSAMLTFVTV